MTTLVRILTRGELAALHMAEEDFAYTFSDSLARNEQMGEQLSSILEVLRIHPRVQGLQEFRGRITLRARWMLHAAFPGTLIRCTHTSPYFDYVSEMHWLPEALSTLLPLHDFAIWVTHHFKRDNPANEAALRGHLRLNGIKRFTLRVPLSLLEMMFTYPLPETVEYYIVEIDAWMDSQARQWSHGSFLQVAQSIHRHLRSFPQIRCSFVGVRPRINAPASALDKAEARAMKWANRVSKQLLQCNLRDGSLK